MNARNLLVSAVALLLPIAAVAGLKQGDAAPDFTAPASLAGKEVAFSLAEARKKGAVVVYFYPSAYTQGCNIQARTFAQQIDQFASAGATVVGVSLDSIERLHEFSADPDYCGGKLTVASDASGNIAKSFGVTIIDSFGGKQAVTMLDTRGKQIGHNFSERVTFIVTADGKIASTIGGLSPAENVQAALEAVKALQSKAG
jgi:peroxiredoxin